MDWSGRKMNNSKVEILCTETGELFSLYKISKGCVKSMKRELDVRLKYDPNGKIEVLEACSEAVKEYFINHINKAREYYLNEKLTTQ